MNLKEIASNVRVNIINQTADAQSGHPGGSLSGVEILTLLQFEVMNIPSYDSPERDRFVLSKGHASPLLYGVLEQKGVLSKEDLKTFRKINTHLQGHPDMNKVTGVDMTAGSLGLGICAAVGMALAGKLDQKDYRVYTLLGDGEIQEGTVWEAFMSAAHYDLDNLCVIIDNNGLQIDGKVSDVMSPYPIKEKMEAFGFNAIEVDGHSFDELRNAFENAKNTKGKPTAIIAHTVKGKGVSFMENNASWHGSAPNEEQRIQAIKEITEGINE